MSDGNFSAVELDRIWDGLRVDSDSEIDEEVSDDEISEADSDIEEGRGMKRVEELRQENDESAHLHFSRACRVCLTPEPRERSACKACGHAVCRECADAPTAANAASTCFICTVRSDFVQLFEEKDESNAAFSRTCFTCFSAPRQRAVYTNCGHVCCLACAEELQIKCREDRDMVVCPFCRTTSAFVKLQEELTQDQES
ncbi:hypothetical protein PRIPAC_84522 [Pristionchus pacificus]|uniref:Uncharacterized protein n=1 Tax=Pristionchus pacificus TaxID=54126 RepID=A0A2A6BN76_PRIPA|nr:hypothetical protein PRIPAC_84522 [Pristionchus pacificus]|eukprot:PDM67412.1 hypothetical protein PRIPAC_48829 [Pristionchus pacificus]